MRKYKKMSASTLIAVTLFAAVVAGCSALPENLSKAVIGEGSGSGDSVRIGKKSFQSDEFDSIDVNTQAMEIYVTRGAGKEAEAELIVDSAIQKRFTFEAEVKSRVLQLDVNEEDKPTIGFNKGQEGERRLNISLPDQIYDKLTITNNFGLVEASDVKAKQVNIQIDAGAIRLDSVSGDMNLETDAGEIVVNRISLENDITAKTDAGQIEIHLKESPKAAQLELVSEVGEVNADLENVRYSQHTSTKKMGAVGSGGPRINAYTSVGRIVVDTNNP